VLTGRGSYPGFVFECSEDEFAAIADAELDALPAWVKARVAAANVAIDVQDEREGEPETLGLFRQQVMDGMQMAEITLYRLPILRAAGVRDRLPAQVHDVILHELGHLFGMSEADLDEFSIGNHPRPGATPVHPPPPRA
jgi:predicted Zn-dependent protease with MMP-like domain